MPTISASPGPVVPCRPCHAGRSGRPGRAPAPEGTDAGRVQLIPTCAPRRPEEDRRHTHPAGSQAGHGGARPTKPEDDGRRTCPADGRGACGRDPTKPEEDGRRSRSADSQRKQHADHPPPT